MTTDLLDLLSAHGSQIALLQDGHEHTYADLVERARGAGEWLAAQGVRPHDCVLLEGDFSLESTAVLLALNRNRNVVVPIVNLTPLAWESLRDTCAPSFRIGCRGEATCAPIEDGGRPAHGLLDELRRAGASGLVLQSSGSSGRPKVILHNLDGLIDAAAARARKARLSFVLFLMYDHIGGVNTLLNVLTAGSTGIVLRERSPDEVCSLVQRHRARVLPTSPTFLNLLLVGKFNERYDLSSLKLITYGTEPMPDALLARVRAAFPGARLLQTFGTSETGVSSTSSESSGSTYFRIDDALFEHRVIDGELHLRSRTQFLGYLNQSSDNVTDDGWFKTGDLVDPGADGYFRIRGRVSEIINVGGEKVLPLEVESILLHSPLVEDCVVYGEPNAITGQHVCAEIKPRGEVSPGELRTHVREFLEGRVAAYKIPARIRAVGEIRRSSRFKKVRSAS